MRHTRKRAGLAGPEEQQERWVRADVPECVEAFDRYSLELLRIAHGAEEGGRAIHDATSKAGPRGVEHHESIASSKGWLAIRREVALEQSRAGNLSEEVMREVFDAVDAGELALDTKGALRKR